MPSPTYRVFREAILRKKQVTCWYANDYRELCPVILGHSEGEEKAMTYQFGGTSGRGLPPGGAWRCLYLSRVRDARLRDGPGHEGADRHSKEQTCVVEVNLWTLVSMFGRGASPHERDSRRRTAVNHPERGHVSLRVRAGRHLRWRAILVATHWVSAARSSRVGPEAQFPRPQSQVFSPADRLSAGPR
jgi:hypothetical protein